MDIILTIAAIAGKSQASAAAQYRYASQFFSGTLDSTWPHAVLICVSVAAGIAAGTGIVLEAKKFFSLPTMLVVFGVAVESICTILLFGFDEGISRKQETRIEQLLAQRVVSPEQKERIARVSKKFPSVTFWTVTTPENEPWGLVMAIAAELKSDGWNWAPCPGGVPPLDGRPASCMTITAGIQINAPDNLKPVGNALVEALTDPDVIGMDNVRLDPNANPSTMMVIVGSKR